MKCSIHQREMECLGGCSAHPDNWYCRACDTEAVITTLISEVHHQNVAMGWWGTPRSQKTLLMLVVSELAEAMEGHRKDLQDEHLPTYKAADVELADALIRLLDLGGYFRWTFSMTFPSVPSGDFPDKLFSITRAIVTFPNKAGWSLAIERLLLTAPPNIFQLVKEKLAYNKTRADHQLSARQALNGKRY